VLNVRGHNPAHAPHARRKHAHRRGLVMTFTFRPKLGSLPQPQPIRGWLADFAVLRNPQRTHDAAAGAGDNDALDDMAETTTACQQQHWFGTVAAIVKPATLARVLSGSGTSCRLLLNMPTCCAAVARWPCTAYLC